MKSVQLNGILVCESDIGREIEVRGFIGVGAVTHTIERLEDNEIVTKDGWYMSHGECTVKWASPPIPPQTTEPYCPRQQAANVLREAYAKCEELGMDVCSYGDGSLSITYQPEAVDY
jgi:hypothetical protein